MEKKKITIKHMFMSDDERRAYFNEFPNELEDGLCVVVGEREHLLYDGTGWSLLARRISIPSWRDVFDTKKIFGHYDIARETAKNVGYSMIAFNGKVYDVNDPDMDAICDVEEVR